MKIKIAFIIPCLEYGGAQTMMLRLVDKMNFDKYEVIVLVRDSALNNELENMLKAQGVECIFLDIKKNLSLLKRISAFYKFKKVLDFLKPDILHVHLESIYSYMYAILKRKKVIVTIHSWPDRIVGKRLKVYVELLRRHNLIWFVGCANSVTERARDLMPKVKKNIECIYNPIDLSKYKCVKRNDRNIFTYIHVGRMTEIKNQRMLIRAFSAVVKELPQSELLMVGNGELYEELQMLSEDLGLTDKIIFLGNISNVQELLSKSDVMVLSSDSECCPMAVLESMASGVPVISTAVGGIPELISECGILVSKGNLQELIEGMCLVQNDKFDLKNLKYKCLERIQPFSAELIAQQYEKMYDDIFIS